MAGAVSADGLDRRAEADVARGNERLRLESRVLKDERDVLEKATQYFASQKP